MTQLWAALMSIVVVATSAAALSGQTFSKVQEEVLAADRGYWEAVNACDAAKWESFVADEVVFITAGGTVYDKGILRADHFKNVPCKNNYRIEPLVVRIYGDAAIVNGNFVYGGGKSTAAYTRVFIRQQGKWRLVSVQHQPIKHPLTARDGKLVTSPSR